MINSSKNFNCLLQLWDTSPSVKVALSFCGSICPVYGLGNGLIELKSHTGNIMRSVSWGSESSNENWGLSVCKDMNQAVCVHCVHSLDITYTIPKMFNICGKFITLHI
mgnify:CR=1 FL=1